MALKSKFERIDQSKLKQGARDVLAKMKEKSENFTNAEVNKKIEPAIDKLIERLEKENPDALKKASVTRTQKPKATAKKKATKKAPAKTSGANRETVMTVAKRIRKDGEKWQDALKRAKSEMGKDTEKKVSAVKTEVDKLKKLIETDAVLKGFANSELQRDAVRKAKPRGKRKTTTKGETTNQYGTFKNKVGRTYWESRENRSDRYAPKYPKNKPFLEMGGDVTDAQDLTMANADFLVMAKGGDVRDEGNFAKTPDNRYGKISKVNGLYYTLKFKDGILPSKKVYHQRDLTFSDSKFYAKGGEVADINKFKKQLIAKAKRKGLYENFGQAEVRKLEDKYGYSNNVREFDNWAMDFDLSQMAKGGEIDAFTMSMVKGVDDGISEVETKDLKALMEKGGEMASADITRLRKNIMGTLSFDLKVGSMRKAQDFIVYPMSELEDKIKIQSSKKFGVISLEDGKGILSKGNGNTFMHLRRDMAMRNVITFKLTSSQLEELKNEIRKTGGSKVGNSVIFSDNSGASLLAKGGMLDSKIGKLKKGDEITIKFESSISKDNTVNLKVRSRNKIRKGTIDKITFDNVKNPKGVKYYAYERGNGKWGFAKGDLAISNIELVNKKSMAKGGTLESKFDGYETMYKYALANNFTPRQLAEELRFMTNLQNKGDKELYDFLNNLSNMYPDTPISEFKKGGRLKSALMRDRKYFNKNESWERAYSKGKNRRGYKEDGGTIENSIQSYQNHYKGFPSYAKGGEIEETQYGSWYVKIHEDENDEEIRNQEVARLIREGYTSGYEPRWYLEITDIDGDVDEATEEEIARLVEEGYTSGEVVMYKDNYAKGGMIEEWSIQTDNEDEHFDNEEDAREFWESLSNEERKSGQYFRKSYFRNQDGELEEDEVEIIEEFAKGGRLKSALMRDRKYYNKNEAWERAYSKGKNRRGYKENGGTIADSTQHFRIMETDTPIYKEGGQIDMDL